MKTLISITLVLAGLTFAFGQTENGGGAQTKKGGGGPKSEAHVLTNAEFDSLLAHPEQLLIIDVRRPDELTAIGGFPAYLSIQQNQLAQSLAWIPKDRTIVTVSNHAARGGVAADILTKAGFKVAGTIGAQTYEQAGGKLTHIAAPAPKAAQQ
jgi:rhodanese-related sulfurtransferase